MISKKIFCNILPLSVSRLQRIQGRTWLRRYGGGTGILNASERSLLPSFLNYSVSDKLYLSYTVKIIYHSIFCCSDTKSYLTFCNPRDCSTPAFPVLYYLLELAQTHVHLVGDAIQPSHPLLSPSPPAFNLSQHQGLFQSQFFASGGQSIGVSASASALTMNIQD